MTSTMSADETNTQTPPHDVQAEQAVLGSMMLSKDALGDAAENLKPADFYQPRHGRIFTAILYLYAEDTPADAVTVAARLVETGDIGKVGGAGYLHDIIAGVHSPSSVGYYAAIVRSAAQRRGVIETGYRISRLGLDPAVEASTAIDRSQQLVYELGSTSTRTDLERVGDLLAPTMNGMEQASSGQQEVFPTGFADMDRLLSGGLRPAQFVAIAGRPGMGKTTAMLDVARWLAFRRNIPVAFFSLEMTKVELVEKILSAEARVPYSRIRDGNLSDDDWQRIVGCTGKMAEAPLFVDDSADLNLMEIRAKARRMKQQHNLKVIIVDYLQLMTSHQRAESRQQEVAGLSRGLKLLAKELEVANIVGAQLNRESEKRQDKRPVLSDLRESGSIEQDCDIVWFVHRPDQYDGGESPRAGEADFIIAKHRAGPTDTVTVAAQLHFSRFIDMAI